MSEIREDMIKILYTIIKNKKISKDVEIGIYNWALNYCEKRGIIKKWSNESFKKLYVRKTMSIYDNLNKKSYIKNSRLLKRLKSKEFKGNELACMAPQHTFPEHWKEMVDNLNKINSKAWENRTENATDIYTCGRCKQKKCTYYELQLRGADESMTVFIACTICGNRWRN